MIVNISELEKGNGKLYMQHGNLDIAMVYLRFRLIMLYTVKFMQNRRQKQYERIKNKVKVLSMLMC